MEKSHIIIVQIKRDRNKISIQVFLQRYLVPYNIKYFVFNVRLMTNPLCGVCAV